VPGIVRQQVVDRVVARWPESTRGARFARRAKRFIAGAHLSPDAAYAGWVSLLSRDARAALLTSAVKDAAECPDGDATLHHYLTAPSVRSLLDRATALDVEQYLPEYQLTYMDRMSMAHGLEVRAPLADYTLVDYVTSLPVNYRLKGGRSKHIFKEVAQSWIDPAIVNRKKVGFDSPIGQWFKDELRSFVTRFMARDQISQTGLLDPLAVERLIGEHLSGQRDYSLQLWSLLTLETWHRMYIEGGITDGRHVRLSDLRGASAVAGAHEALAGAV
jgi:asparagine synthase (glutamine-hydrolysing)